MSLCSLLAVIYRCYHYPYYNLSLCFIVYSKLTKLPQTIGNTLERRHSQRVFSCQASSVLCAVSVVLARSITGLFYRHLLADGKCLLSPLHHSVHPAAASSSSLDCTCVKYDCSWYLTSFTTTIDTLRLE